jgi:predicted oxidoreductase
MKSLTLGPSTLVSSRLAYGCWRIAGPGPLSELTAERQAQGRAAVIAAYESGFTLFDLADIYADGVAETIFGQALKEVPAMRSQIVVASKCGIRKRGEPGPDAPYRYDFSAEHIVSSCEQSLRRMGIETIDLYQLHRPDYLADPAEVAEAFAQLKRAGKVREFGVSNFRPAQVTWLRRACPFPLLSNQVEISLVRLDCFHDGTLDQCMAEGMTPMAWSPLGGGRLGTDTPIDLQDPHHAHRLRIRETLDLIARRHGVSRVVVALSWLLKHPSRIVPVVGSTRPEHIRDAAQADGFELTREAWYQLLEAALGQRLP